MYDDGATHAVGCYAGGRDHYRCALVEVIRLRQALYDCLQAAEDGPIVDADDADARPDVAKWALDAVRELRSDRLFSARGEVG